ncbi:MAG: triose-phosphate isomerase [Devosia sp.]|uniref:triose-phosphate isomerase n=1 Tax=Devosia sp. TaxID=1871048 RepID=UPI0037C158E9
MADRRIPLIAGNWKMNGLNAALVEIDKLAGLLGAGERPDCAVAICPPATLLSALSARAGATGILTGGQDCHPKASGAHTGDISAVMLADAGATYVIVGHSERRTDHHEDDALVRSKALAALGAGLTPIICVGETRAEREAGRAIAVVTSQLLGSVPDEAGTNEVVIAYEPVWAIGTGLTPTIADVEAMHASIRAQLADRFGAAGKTIRILYGGSMKPANAKEILAVANVDGGLVGGASLLANDFYGIISAV